MLLIQGDIDNNVHPAKTFVLAEELIKAGKRYDMKIVPGKRTHDEEYNE
jgi:Dipeptidyl aminopeptidases/acylaminoacyl-peptidases